MVSYSGLIFLLACATIRLAAGSRTEELLKVQADLLQQLSAVQAQIASTGASDSSQLSEVLEGGFFHGRALLSQSAVGPAVYGALVPERRRELITSYGGRFLFEPVSVYGGSHHHHHHRHLGETPSPYGGHHHHRHLGEVSGPYGGHHHHRHLGESFGAYGGSGRRHLIEVVTVPYGGRSLIDTPIVYGGGHHHHRHLIEVVGPYGGHPHHRALVSGPYGSTHHRSRSLITAADHPGFTDDLPQGTDPILISAIASAAEARAAKAAASAQPLVQRRRLGAGDKITPADLTYPCPTGSRVLPDVGGWGEGAPFLCIDAEGTVMDPIPAARPRMLLPTSTSVPAYGGPSDSPLEARDYGSGSGTDDGSEYGSGSSSSSSSDYDYVAPSYPPPAAPPAPPPWFNQPRLGDNTGSAMPTGYCYCRMDPNWEGMFMLDEPTCKDALYERSADASSGLTADLLDSYYTTSFAGANTGSVDTLARRMITTFLYQDCPSAPPCGCTNAQSTKPSGPQECAAQVIAFIAPVSRSTIIPDWIVSAAVQILDPATTDDGLRELLMSFANDWVASNVPATVCKSFKTWNNEPYLYKPYWDVYGGGDRRRNLLATQQRRSEIRSAMASDAGESVQTAIVRPKLLVDTNADAVTVFDLARSSSTGAGAFNAKPSNSTSAATPQSLLFILVGAIALVAAGFAAGRASTRPGASAPAPAVAASVVPGLARKVAAVPGTPRPAAGTAESAAAAAAASPMPSPRV